MNVIAPKFTRTEFGDYEADLGDGLKAVIWKRETGQVWSTPNARWWAQINDGHNPIRINRTVASEQIRTLDEAFIWVEAWVRDMGSGVPVTVFDPKQEAWVSR